jgi:hypothetical protein
LFVEGRKIYHGVRLIQDIINWHGSEERGGAIIFLDQTKAFDRVERNWLKETLTSMGMGKISSNGY